MISKETIDRVFETALVEEVISDFIQLKKSGSNFKGLSPFTDEKTPALWFPLLNKYGKILVAVKEGMLLLF